MIHWWRGDGNPEDSVGNADGQWSGNPAYGPGVAGEAFSFSGTDATGEFVRAPLTYAAGFSVDLWVNASEDLGMYTPVIASSDLDANPYFQIDMDGEGNYRVQAETASFWLSFGAISLGQFQNLAMTYDGSQTVTTYLDGQLANTGTYTAGVLTFNTFKIGENRSVNHWLSGLVGDIQMYNRVLSAAEVRAIYRGAVDCPGVSPPTSSQSASDSTTFDQPGTYSWTVPDGVTTVSVLVVGGGGGSTTAVGNAGGGGGGALCYSNGISVTPGSVVRVAVGSGGGSAEAGGQSSFGGMVVANGGAPGTANAGGAGGHGAGGTCFDGGSGGGFVGSGTGFGGGGGGAAGYAGAGGAGAAASGSLCPPAGVTSAGGGGGGGGSGSDPTNYSWGSGGGGGGVGLRGAGNPGAGGATACKGPSSLGQGGQGGAGGAAGTGAPAAQTGGSGGLYGGGGGGGGEIDPTGGEGVAGFGASGAVRILWGAGKSYPSNAN